MTGSTTGWLASAYAQAARVPAGQTSTLTLVAQNCTGQTLPGQTIWFGQYTWPGPGVPPGCPAIDPALIPYTLGPAAVTTTAAQDGDTIPGCLATGLQVTVEFTVSNVGTVAQVQQLQHHLRPQVDVAIDAGDAFQA